MELSDPIKQKLYSEMKLNGILLRREFCSLIVDTLINADINIDNEVIFDNSVRLLCESLERTYEAGRSIERENVERAIEVVLRAGYDESQTIFSVIDEFDVPKYHYNLDRKIYTKERTKKSILLSDADSKADLFVDRYTTILQRTRRCFINKRDNKNITLQTVDYLLTVSHRTLENTLILGSLFIGASGKYYLEDPTGMVELNLKHAKYSDGFFNETCFVLVNGCYDDKVLQVSTIALPPGEEYKESRSAFGNLNYFGGRSETPLRDSTKLLTMMNQNENSLMIFISDLWLDKYLVFEKLETIFQGFMEAPPIAFVFIGNFLSKSSRTDSISILQKSFKQLAELIQKYEDIHKNSNFVFIPGMNDPNIPYIIPRMPLPKVISDDFKNLVPKSHFSTNPCRIQYCTREIVVYRADLLSKFIQDTLHNPDKDNIGNYVTRSLVSQGHLSPFSLNVQPVHWSYDYTLQLYPLPNLVIIGDKSSPYMGKYKGCCITNPGSFHNSGFSFKSYDPVNDLIEDCSV